MLHHIVFWKLKDSFEGKNKIELAKAMKTQLENLTKSIPQIVSLSVHLSVLNSHADPQAADVVLISAFVSEKELAEYIAHPDHQNVVSFIKQIALERRVVDYVE